MAENGKKMIGIYLSGESQRHLDELTKMYNLERSGIIEGLLRGANKKTAQHIETGQCELWKEKAQKGERYDYRKRVSANEAARRLEPLFTGGAP